MKSFFKKVFKEFFLLGGGGIIAAIISLVLAALFLFPSLSEEKKIIFLIIIEECSKLLIIWQVFGSFFDSEKVKKVDVLLGGFFLGNGFSLFEFFLLKLNKTKLDLISFSPVVIVHILSSLMLAVSTFLIIKKKNKWLIWLFFTFAILIHLCYNVFVKEKQ